LSVFDKDKITYEADWQDGVNARLNWMQKEIEALRLKQSHYDNQLRNIKIDVEGAIKECLTTLNIADDLP